MAIPNPDHLLDQAERLMSPLAAGPPRKADLRRAVSAAYYALFHAVVAAAADLFGGGGRRPGSRYALIYRAVDHRRIREVCEDLAKATPPARYRSHLPGGSPGRELPVIAALLVGLQEERHAADYDPLVRYRAADVRLVVATARIALAEFRAMPAEPRDAFLALLLFPPRR